MLPAAIVPLDRLPKLPNGKVDRAASHFHSNKRQIAKSLPHHAITLTISLHEVGRKFWNWKKSIFTITF
jgi:hypothetical protein